MSDNKISKMLNRLAGIALIFGMSYCSYNFLSAETRIKKLCNEITPGMTIPQLHEFGQKHDMNTPKKTNGTTYMVETKTFGRFGCELQLSNGVVQSVQYNFAD